MKNTKRKNYKHSNRKNKVYNPLRTQFDSNGPLGRVRGTAQQIVDKYVVAARETRSAGDRVLGEELQQYSEHYARMIVQWRIDNPVPEKDETQDNDQQKLSESKPEIAESDNQAVGIESAEIVIVESSDEKEAV